ncbi:MAG: hypothetical protein PHN51_11770 [Candidatus Nanopelagicales bacterium]|nr:hypothetical protein [Candidatus Nanopelagicales bacterium]
MTEIVSDWRSIPGVVDYLANRLGGAESMEIEDMLISRSSASEQETLAFLWATQKQVESVTSNHGRVRFI